VNSGDTVTLHTVSGGPDILPAGDGFEILPEHLTIHEALAPGGAGHIMTGPVAVKGARPGDMLEVRIKDVQLRQNWGWNRIRPLSGALPDDFHETRLLHIRLDKEKKVANLPWGVDLPAMPDCLMFHVVTEGHCLLEVKGEATRTLTPGAFTLVPHGQGHVLRSAAKVRVSACESRKPSAAPTPSAMKTPTHGETTSPLRASSLGSPTTAVISR